MKVAIARCANYEVATVGAALDELWRALGRDPDDPFRDLVEPGMDVFLKPNWVASRWRESCGHRDDIFSVITHPAVIEGVVDKIAVALRGEGTITVADNPSIDADFDELMDVTGIRRIEDKYDVPVSVMDLRPLVCTDLADYGQKDKMECRPGDPKGEAVVNLGRDSLLADVDPALFRGVFDQRDETIASHTGSTQLYSYSRTLYDADVYVSVPKLKTHHKTGATLNLKGLVGSVSNKNQLVHWRMGSPETGGDEYASKEKLEAARTAAVLERGAHPGNDTIWRMVVDLYRGMRKRERRYFSVVDGVLAGEGKGPFCPTGRWAQVLVAGDSLAPVDAVAARLMGMDPAGLRYLAQLLDTDELDLADIEVVGGLYDAATFFAAEDPYLDFRVPEAWQGIKVSSRRDAQ